MIFMRAHGVDQSVSSKSLPHRVGYWTHWTSTVDIANEIHYPVMIYLPNKGCDPQRVRRILINFSLLATSELLAPHSSPFIHH